MRKSLTAFCLTLVCVTGIMPFKTVYAAKTFEDRVRDYERRHPEPQQISPEELEYIRHPVLKGLPLDERKIEVTVTPLQKTYPLGAPIGVNITLTNKTNKAFGTTVYPSRIYFTPVGTAVAVKKNLPPPGMGPNPRIPLVLKPQDSYTQHFYLNTQLDFLHSGKVVINYRYFMELGQLEDTGKEYVKHSFTDTEVNGSVTIELTKRNDKEIQKIVSGIVKQLDHPKPIMNRFVDGSGLQELDLKYTYPYAKDIYYASLDKDKYIDKLLANVTPELVQPIVDILLITDSSLTDKIINRLSECHRVIPESVLKHFLQLPDPDHKIAVLNYLAENGTKDQIRLVQCYEVGQPDAVLKAAAAAEKALCQKYGIQPMPQL